MFCSRRSTDILNDIYFSVAGVSKIRSRSNCFGFILLLLDLHWIVIRNSLIAGSCIFVFAVVAVILLKKQSSQNDVFDATYKDPYYNDSLGNHSVVYRKQWGGLPPKSTPIPVAHPIHLVIVSCDLKNFCNTSESCAVAVRSLQKTHQSLKHFLDVGYNFMIGGDGDIYVGTGWDAGNFHKKLSIGINFLGNFVYDELTDDMIDAFNVLVKQGLQLRKISEDYKLVGENQTNPHNYLSPGPNVYRLMKNWLHFYNNTWF